MSVDRIDTFLAGLRRAHLLSTEQIDAIVRDLVPCYQDVGDLGTYLVEIDWITAYQLHLLLNERWSELTCGVYQILDRLGEGGISEVFKAWDSLRGRVVALKILHPHLTGNRDVVRQFQREMTAITGLSHPNILRTYEAHDQGPAQYFAMEFIEGMDLDRYVLQVGPLAVEQACDYVRQVAQGLQYAHQVGLIHRDIKPANLLLVNPPLVGPSGQPVHHGQEAVVKIIDWGLARCSGDPADSTQPAGASDLESEKISLIGTADYISPEQAQDATLVDIRTDIYSLGCVMHYLLTGYPPFRGATLMQKLVQHQKAEPPSLKTARPDVPDELDLLVRKMLAKAPEERPQIPLLVIGQLRRFCTVPGVGRGFGGPGSALGLPALGSRSAAGAGRAGQAPPTGLNLPRPQTHSSLTRPGTQPNLPRPGGRP